MSLVFMDRIFIVIIIIIIWAALMWIFKGNANIWYLFVYILGAYWAHKCKKKKAGQALIDLMNQQKLQ